MRLARLRAGLVGASSSRFPVVAIGGLMAALLVVAAWAVSRNELDGNGRAEVRAMLESRLSVTETALDRWQDQQLSTAEAWASNARVVELARSLVQVEHDQPALLATPLQGQLRDQLTPVLDAYDYEGFFLIAPDGTSLASTRDANTGTRNLLAEDQPEVFADLLAGHPRVTHPQFTDVPIENAAGTLDRNAPTMFVGSPVFDGTEVLAVLTFRLAPEHTFAEVFTTQRWGRSGEALAVERDGTLLVESRFEDELVAAGVLAEGRSRFKAVALEDPGVDLTGEGNASVSARPSSQPTAAARSVLAGRTDATASGYDSYLGRPVVGAWTWDERLGMGIVVEVDEREALAVVHRAVRTLDLFAAAALGTTLLAAYLAAREQRQRRHVERLNESLGTTQANLRQVNEDLAHFAHLAAHDLREPCRRQQMLTSMLVDLHAPDLDEEAQHQIGMVATQSRSMLSMIDGFRALTNIVGPAPERSTVDLDRIVADLVDELVPTDDRADVVTDLPTAISAYPDLIELLYRNLITNAVTHGSRPSALRLTSSTDRSERTYSVSNEVAAGRQATERDLFQPFVRQSDTPGSGLGLSICKRVVQYHQGTISIDRTDDTFVVHFTLKEPTR